jgi:hypothetical protein
MSTPAEDLRLKGRKYPAGDIYSFYPIGYKYKIYLMGDN